MKQFDIYKEYNRDILLESVGSKQPQTGILWGPLEPGCVIVTSGGRHSKRAGYEDMRNADGSWSYFGQGEKGNQDLASFANNLLVKRQRTVLLFTTREPTSKEIKFWGSYAKKYRFEGYYGVAGWDWFIPKEGSRKGSRLLRFRLVPVNLNGAAAFDAKSNVSMSTEQLRAELKVTMEPSQKYISETEYHARSMEIRNYARLRASGVCEYCSRPAPFLTPAGQPFLEVHHILRLADDGPDHPENVAALCPNCHRNMHHGIDAVWHIDHLLVLVREKERLLDSKGME